MRYTDACRITKGLEEDSYIYKDNNVEFERQTEKHQSILHVMCLTARLIHQPDTYHIQK